MGVVHILTGIEVAHAIHINTIPIYILKNVGSIMRFFMVGFGLVWYGGVRLGQVW